MIGRLNLNDKIYSEIFDQALNSIPIVSKEWTDYNYSDPGITTIQILSIIKLFQQAKVDRITDKTRIGLLKLLGYDVEGIKSSIANVDVRYDDNTKILQNTKLLAGDIIFETCQEEAILGGSLKNVIMYDSNDNKYVNLEPIIQGQSNTVTYVFGKNPKIESALYLVFDNKMELGKKYKMYFKIPKMSLNRNRVFIPDENPFSLSDIKWEYYSNENWNQLNVEDKTKGFLQSGSIIFSVDQDIKIEKLENIGEGCIIRAILKSHQYDLPPKVQNISVNNFSVVQKDTQAKSFIFDGKDEDIQVYEVENFLCIYDKIVVLAKDQYGIYKKYYHSDIAKKGNFCEIKNDFEGKIRITFDNNKFGFKPSFQKESVKIICYNNKFNEKDIIHKVYGFDDQVIKLEGIEKGIVKQDFKLMITVVDFDGEESFYNVNHDEDESSIIVYELDDTNNEIIIKELNIEGDINILITDCSLSRGKNGNVREGEINRFVNLNEKKKHNFYNSNIDNIDNSDNSVVKRMTIRNLERSSGGMDKESVDDVIMKVINDISFVHSLVTQHDFETKVFEVPGINVHKVRAIFNEIKNNVSIIVKPYSNEELPNLMETYKEAIANYLESFRLVTTDIEINSPVYVPINVSGSIYIKPGYKNAEKIVKELIAEELDGINSDRDFGSEIIFGNIYSKLEGLSCVDSIHYLSLDTVSPYAKKQVNSNISLNMNALSYMANYNIDLINKIITVI